MKTKTHSVTIRSYLKGRFFVLLVAILFMLVLSPLLTGFVRIKILLDIFLSIIIISGIYAVSQNKTNVLITVTLAIPLLVSTWTSYFVQIPYLMLTGRICGFLCFFFMIIAILVYILQLKEVTVDTIFGSLVAYLLTAIMWSNIYSG